MTAYDDTIKGKVPTEEETWRRMANAYSLEVGVKKLHDRALMPTYATLGSACFDLYAIEAAELLPGGHTATISTGLAFEIPEGWVMKIYSRSGHGFNFDVSLANSVGVIDSDYRGEVMVKLRNDSPARRFNVYPGDRIAQAMLERRYLAKLTPQDDLSETERGTGGFGSTGA